MRRTVFLLASALLFPLKAPTPADPISSTSTYFTMHRDQRLCPSLACGGYFVARVNHATTRCADVTEQSACYAAKVNFTGAWADDQTLAAAYEAIAHDSLLVAGTIDGPPSTLPPLGRRTLTASQIWLRVLPLTGSTAESRQE